LVQGRGRAPWRSSQVHPSADTGRRAHARAPELWRASRVCRPTPRHRLRLAESRRLRERALAWRNPHCCLFLESDRAAAAGTLAGAEAHRAPGGRATADVTLCNRPKPGRWALSRAPAHQKPTKAQRTRLTFGSSSGSSGRLQELGPVGSSPLGHLRPSGTFSPLTAR
jgi:hypothetical protein